MTMNPVDPNPWQVVRAPSDGYTASNGEFVISDFDTVELPSIQDTATVAVRAYQTDVTVLNPDGTISGNSDVTVPPDESVKFVTAGNSWYIARRSEGDGVATEDEPEVDDEFLTLDNVNSEDDLPDPTAFELPVVFELRTGDLAFDYQVPVDPLGVGEFTEFYSLIDGEMPEDTLNRLALGDNGDDGTFIYETNNWILDRILPQDEQRVYAVEFSPDGEYLATGDNNGTLYIRTTDDWEIEQTFDYDFHDLGQIRTVSFSNDNTLLAYGESELFVHNRSDWSVEFNIDTDYIYTSDISPNDEYLSIGLMEKLEIYETSNWELDETLSADDRVDGVSFSPDGQYIAYGDMAFEATAYIYTTPISDTGWSSVTTFGADNEIRAVEFDPDTEYLAIGFRGGVHILSTSDWELQTTLEFERDSVRGLSFSPDGELLAVASGGDGYGRGYIFSTSDWEMVQELDDPDAQTWSVDFSPP